MIRDPNQLTHVQSSHEMGKSLMVNISMLIISTIWFMFDLSVSSVLRPYLYMPGSSSLTRVFRMCKTILHPLYVNIESITPERHVVSQQDELSQRCILRENTCTLKFSKRSSYNATINQNKIRCIKDKHHMQSKICDMIWPSSSCAFDLHLQSIVMISIVTGMTPWSPSSWSISMCHHVVVSPTIALATIATA